MPFMVPAPVVLVRAAPAARLQADTAYESWTSDALCQYASELLRRGRRYNSAIEALEAAARKSPDNLQVRLALSCAYASRFASVTDVAKQQERYNSDKTSDDRRRSEWEQDQKNPESERFGKAAPKPLKLPLNVFKTQDDDRRFTLTASESKKELLRLAKACVATLEVARNLAQNQAPDKRAEAEWTRGWALWTLLRFGPDIIQNAPPPPASTSAKSDAVYVPLSDVSDCFRAAARAAPDNVAYLHSLGLSVVTKYLQSNGVGDSENEKAADSQKPAEVAEAVKAFRATLALDPHNFDLQFQYSLICARTMPEESLTYLEKAARRRNGNAALWYRLAEQRFRVAYKKNALNAPLPEASRAAAVEAVKIGNAAPQYAAVPFVLPLPASLKKAWEFEDIFGYGADAGAISHLGSYLSDDLKESLKRTDDKTALQTARLMMDLGLKVIRTGADGFSVRNPSTQALIGTRALMGCVNCYFPSDLIAKAQKTNPSEDKAKFLESITDTMRYVRAVDKEIVDNL